MSHRRFTESGDPSVENAVEQKLSLLVASVRRMAGVDAVLLGGSLARGEGTVVDGTLRSDAEVYLVGGSSRLRRVASQLESDLNADGQPPELSVAWTDPRRLARGWAKNLSRRSSPTIHLYELARGSRILAGERPAMFVIDPARIPVAEGIRLMLNRMAEAAPLVAGRDPAAARWLDKILIACGDTVLLAAGAYCVGYRERAYRLASTQAPWKVSADARTTMRRAYERKLSGRGTQASVEEVALLAGEMLREAIARTVGFEVDSWATFPDQFVTRASRDTAFLRYLPPLGPAARYEGIVLLLRVRRAGLPLSPRALRGALHGRPLSLATQAAAAPLFFGLAGGSDRLVHAAASALADAGVPVAGHAGQLAPLVVARTLRRYWEATA